MKKAHRVGFIALVVSILLALSIGYAAMADTLIVSGSFNVQPEVVYDVYIYDVTPKASGGVTVSNYTATMLSAKITSAASAELSVTVLNRSDKVYVFERVVDGAEVDIDGIYNGTDITYTLEGIKVLDELQGGQRITFKLKIDNPKGVTIDNFYLKFNFLEKTGSEILPGDPVTPSTTVETTTLTPDPGPGTTAPPATTSPGVNVLYGDFRGLVQALLKSDTPNGLNNSNVIYQAMRNILNNNKNRDEDDAYILHCSISSISGGNMSSVAQAVNKNLTNELQFIIEADREDPDKLYLYMYYASDCTRNTPNGTVILTYKQILKRNSSGEWIEDGTYVGRATVGDYHGGGNNGKDVHTVSPYTWKAGAP